MSGSYTFVRVTDNCRKPSMIRAIGRVTKKARMRPQGSRILIALLNMVDLVQDSGRPLLVVIFIGPVVRYSAVIGSRREIMSSL